MSVYRTKIITVSIVAFLLCGALGGAWYLSVLHAPNRVATILLMVVGCGAIVGLGIAAGNLAAIWIQPCPDIELLFKSEVMSQKNVEIPQRKHRYARHVSNLVTSQGDDEFMREALSLVEVA